MADSRKIKGAAVGVILKRTQNRVEEILGNHWENPQSRLNLTEERDTLSRLRVAISRLSSDHVATLRTHVDDFTAQDSERYEVVIKAIEAILGIRASANV